MIEICNIALGARPLVVCDVDDVVLDFLGPFQVFLSQTGHRLLPRSFRLHGNIISVGNGEPADREMVNALIAAFFDAQETWQVPMLDAADALRQLADHADVVFLTAMKPVYYDQRRRLLDSFGLTYPLVAGDDAKGPLVKQLHSDRRHPIAFIDDMVHNLHSVGEHVSDCLLVHLEPQSEIHRFAPPTPDTARRAGDWRQAGRIVLDHFVS